MFAKEALCLLVIGIEYRNERGLWYTLERKSTKKSNLIRGTTITPSLFHFMKSDIEPCLSE